MVVSGLEEWGAGPVAKAPRNEGGSPALKAKEPRCAREDSNL